MDGIIVVAKPPGMTSHDVVAFVRSRTGQRRVGHAGTLDPGAVGVLVVLLGRATRLSDLLMAYPKSYVAEMVLGESRDTQDAFGRVTRRSEAFAVGLDDLRQAALQFTGAIVQVPPMVSAVKHKGVPLYEYARRGEEVDRGPRPVYIYSLEVDLPALRSCAVRERGTEGTGVLPDADPKLGPGSRVLLTVTCSKGTYVRTLVRDIGERLGTGAYMSFLVRTSSGGFTLDEAVTLQEIDGLAALGKVSEAVRPLRDAVRGLRQVVVDGGAARSISSGMTIGADSAVAVLEPEGPVVAVRAAGQGEEGVHTHRAAGGSQSSQSLDDLWAVISRGGDLIALARRGRQGELRPVKVFSGPQEVPDGQSHCRHPQQSGSRE